MVRRIGTSPLLPNKSRLTPDVVPGTVRIHARRWGLLRLPWTVRGFHGWAGVKGGRRPAERTLDAGPVEGLASIMS